MPRRYRNPEITYPAFIYEEYGLDKEIIPLFMTLVLDNLYIPPKEKEFFLDGFGYRYIDDVEFRKKVDGYVLVFEKNKYVTYTNKENVHNVGNPENKKLTVKIGEIEMLGAYYSCTQLTQNENLYRLKIGEILNYPNNNHYTVSVKMTHMNKLVKSKYSNDNLYFDTGNQITTLPCPRYWNYELNEFDFPDYPDISSSSSKMDVSIEEQIKDNELFEESNSIEYWKELFDSAELSYLGTVGSPTPILYIYFKSPLYISVNNLNSKPI